MRLLITINNVRNYRQLSKQLNEDNFEGRVREIQENELTDLLGRALSYDFFNYLDNGFSNQSGTFTRDSDYHFTAAALDLSAWVGYGVKINDSFFGVIKTAVFGGVDTVLTLTDESDILPTTLTTIDYNSDAKYINILNGIVYNCSGDNIKFNGLRPFIAWKLLAIFVMDGTIKHSDVGNFEIASLNFKSPSTGNVHAAKANYLSNSTREENRIIDYLNENDSSFPLWNDKRNQNIQKYNITVI